MAENRLMLDGRCKMLDKKKNDSGLSTKSGKDINHRPTRTTTDLHPVPSAGATGQADNCLSDLPKQ